MALVFLLPALVAGCGSSSSNGSASGTPQTPDELLVSADEIRDAGAGTPTGTVLSWWQALQFGDARGAIRLYAPGVTDEERIAAQLDVSGAPVLAEPEVEEVQKSGKRALVYAVIVSATVTDNNRIDTINRTPVTIRLIRRGNRWVLADNEYLADRAATAQSSQAAKKQAGGAS